MIHRVLWRKRFLASVTALDLLPDDARELAVDWDKASPAPLHQGRGLRRLHAQGDEHSQRDISCQTALSLQRGQGNLTGEGAFTEPVPSCQVRVGTGHGRHGFRLSLSYPCKPGGPPRQATTEASV